MSEKAIASLPESISKHSISKNEIVLPLAQALLAIDHFESYGVLVLGWEGWVKDIAGGVGHSNAPQGTNSIENYSANEAAEFCRKTISQESELWHKQNSASMNTLYFCITVGS